MNVERLVEYWNSHHPPGTVVRAWPTMQARKRKQSCGFYRTTGIAVMMGSEARVRVEGLGLHRLDLLEPTTPDAIPVEDWGWSRASYGQ